MQFQETERSTILYGEMSDHEPQLEFVSFALNRAALSVRILQRRSLSKKCNLRKGQNCNKYLPKTYIEPQQEL